MGAKHAGIETDAANPVADQACILPGRQAPARPARRSEQEFAGLSVCRADVVIRRLPGLFGNLESHRHAGLLLAHCCALDGVSVRRNVFHLRATTSQPRSLLSIARLNIARSRLRSATWSLVRIDQTCFGRSGGLAPTSLPLFQGPRLSEGATEASLSGMVILLVGENGQHAPTHALRS